MDIILLVITLLLFSIFLIYVRGVFKRVDSRVAELEKSVSLLKKESNTTKDGDKKNVDSVVDSMFRTVFSDGLQEEFSRTKGYHLEVGNGDSKQLSIEVGGVVVELEPVEVEPNPDDLYTMSESDKRSVELELEPIEESQIHN